MSFIQIPLSNTLRMVRTDDQSSNLANFDNRLLHQENYFGYYDIPYAQKISSSDPILIQFATDYPIENITAEIYDINDDLISDKTTNITEIVTSTSFSIFDLSFNFAVEGFYYLKLTFDDTEDVIYQSEIFQIDGFNEDRFVKIEYNTSENDGITYNNNQTFIIRIEGRIVEYNPGQKKETYTNYNESLVNLNSYPKRSFKLEYGAVPRYIVEKLNLALAHEVFKVNDVEYQSDGEPDTEIVKDRDFVTNMYKGTVNLQQVDYEEYELATDDVAPDTFRILIDESASLLVVKNEGIEYNVKYKD